MRTFNDTEPLAAVAEDTIRPPGDFLLEDTEPVGFEFSVCILDMRLLLVVFLKAGYRIIKPMLETLAPRPHPKVLR